MMISVLGFVFEIGRATRFGYCLKSGCSSGFMSALHHSAFQFDYGSCEPVCEINCCYHLPCLYGSSFSCF